MLPPQLRSGLVSTSSRSTSRTLNLARYSAGTLSGQSRSFWGWRRGCDWSSQLDSSYQRSQHVRALKTRAKLRAILRRKGKFEWDVLQRPFFTSKHVRWASHWNGPGGKPQWPHQVDDENDENKRAEAKISEEQGHEFSRREKKWRDMMENMRKHINRDPYEAVFGKRFEPFWNPLVPNWMKEALIEEEPKTADQRGQPARSENDSKSVKSDVNVDTTAKPFTSFRIFHSDKSQSAALNTNNKPSSYAYSSSTAWDSWSNRTKQSEWDSVSNKTRRYEYDPISNRMVQVSNAAIEVEKLGGTETKPTPSSTSVTKSSGLPMTTSDEPKSVQVRSPKRTALKALESLPKNDLDLLTADGVRASMGKLKDTTPRIKHERAGLEADFEIRSQTKDHEVDEILLSRKPRDGSRTLQTSLDRSRQNEKSATSTPLQSAVERLQAKKGFRSNEDADDSAAHESTESTINSRSANVPKDWSRQTELLQAERVKRTAGKKPFPMLPRWIDDMNARKAAYEAQQVPTAAQQAEMAKKQRLEAMLVNEVEQQKLRFSIHETRRAHELPNQVLERELGKFDYAKSQPDAAVGKSIDSFNDKAAQPSKALDRSDGSEKGEKSATELQAELKLQQAEAKKGEERYKMKVRTLQAELDTAYKQSSEHSEMHIDHIRKLEKELKRFEGAVSDGAPGGSLSVELADQKMKLEQRYKQKLRLLQTELETAYKQSSKHSQMHMEQIRKLEQELEKVNNATRSESKASNRSSLESLRGEGDFCTNVVKFANSEKWYKRPAVVSSQQQQEGQKLEQKERDRRLVREVRDIYETAYGIIDAQHKQDALQRSLDAGQPGNQGDEGHDVAEALSSYEDSQPYGFQKDNLAGELEKGEVTGNPMLSQQCQSKVGGLADELKQQEKSTVEPVSALHRFQAGGLANEIARQEQEAYEAIAANEQEAASLKKQASLSNVQASSEVESPTESTAIVWQHPASYRILAYDTANDTFSTTSTTSNVTLSEQPISLPQALAQLNQPARFMPHFAELQQDGFQVIYATRDLLLFKQVQPASPPSVEYVSQRTEHLNIHDHGSLRPYENTLAHEAAMYYDAGKATATASASEDPSSVEYGHNFGLTPPENMMAQEAAHAHDLAKQITAKPIDVKVRSSGVKPVTGNFASPTDFVNHDPVTLHSDRATPHNEGEVIQYPKVKRQEPVFSATLPPPPVPTFGRASDSSSQAAQSRATKRDRRRQYREEQLEWRRERQRRRRSGAGAIKWALSVGVLAAGTAHAIGTIAEKTRGREVHDGQSKERWQEILEGKRGRWE